MKVAISPSIFDRVFACPKSAQLCADIVTPTNAAMERGTKLHRELELAFQGLPLEGAPNKMVVKAKAVLLRLRAILTSGDKAVVEYIEAQLDFDWLGIKLGEGRGRVDYAFVNDEEGWVIDFKTGRGSDKYDTPAESWQLRAYACALARKHPEVKRWTLAYLAPERVGGEPFTFGVLDADDIAVCDAMAIQAVKNAKAKDAPLVPSDACGWCPAKSICPALGKALPALGNTTLSVDPTASFLAASPAGRAELWEKLLQAEAWVEALKTAVVAASSTVEVDGYEFKSFSKLKVWTDEVAAEQTLLAVVGNKAYKKELVSPAAALKLVPKVSAFITEFPSEPSLYKKKVKK